jgi:hypothetical protein
VRDSCGEACIGWGCIENHRMRAALWA